MRPLALVAALCAADPAAALTAACRFTTECLDADPCTEADYAFTLDGASGTGESRLVSPAETVPGALSVSPGGATFFFGMTGNALHLLTFVGSEAEARYSVHLPEAGLAVTYLGRCESAQ